MTTIEIGIIGDYDPSNPTHIATDQGIGHAAGLFPSHTVKATWLPTDQRHPFDDFQGLICSPGSPYKSLEGALRGIQRAREKRIPFLGTCGGSQHLVLEYARNVMGIQEASHAESDPYAPSRIVAALSGSLGALACCSARSACTGWCLIA